MTGNLPKKLLRFETPPPPGAWDKIAAALDGAETLAQRLHDYKETPAERNWKAISLLLDNGTSTAKVVPLSPRQKTPLRYLAAASLIFIVALGAVLLLRQPEGGRVVSGNQSVTKNENANLNEDAARTSGLAGAPQAEHHETTKREKGVVAASFKRTLAAIRPQNIFPSPSVSRRFIPRQAKEVTAFNFASADKLMVYSDADGTAMKLPKKLFSLVSCPDGDASCKERIQNLQQKLAASTGPADFVGMLDMVRQLQ